MMVEVPEPEATDEGPAETDGPDEGPAVGPTVCCWTAA